MSQSYRPQIEAVNAKITKLQEQLTELKAKAALGIDLADVQAGRIITFNYGKGESLHRDTGLVLGRKDPEPGAKGGSIVHVRVGSGFDEQIVAIYPQQVTAMQPIEPAPAVEDTEDNSTAEYERLQALLND